MNQFPSVPEQSEEDDYSDTFWSAVDAAIDLLKVEEWEAMQ